VIFGAGAQAGRNWPQSARCARSAGRRCSTRTGVRDREFCQRMEAELGVEVRASRDVQSAIEHAEIICTATNAATSLFNGEWLQPGAHVNAIGAYTAHMRELDAATVARSRIFVDHHPAAQTEAGDILLAIADGAIAYDHVAGELGDVLTGKIPGRQREDEITVFKSVGLAMQDAVTVARVYARAREAGMGHEVAL
ncbi:MAG: ornithine cyclodeaminase, partial [Caldilineaceae bacterium]|nr:ornithine cyclodeaminase [Caldilineaceae bacterium]